eukprot:gene1944-2273_t
MSETQPPLSTVRSNSLRSSSTSNSSNNQQLFQTPHDLECPITLTLFQDPVINSLGQVYERSAIQRHLIQAAVNGQPATDPVSNAVLPSLDLVPVFPMRSRAAEYRESTARKYLTTHHGDAYSALVLKYFGNELLRAGCPDAAADVFYRLLLEAEDQVQQTEYLQLCLDCWTSSSEGAAAEAACCAREEGSNAGRRMLDAVGPCSAGEDALGLPGGLGGVLEVLLAFITLGNRQLQGNLDALAHQLQQEAAAGERGEARQELVQEETSACCFSETFSRRSSWDISDCLDVRKQPPPVACG